MSLYCATGSVESDLLPQLQDLLAESLAKLGKRNRVLVVPPDQSRVHSRSGDLTRYAWEYYGDRLQVVLPALGKPRGQELLTRTPMGRFGSTEELRSTYAPMPHPSFPGRPWSSTEDFWPAASTNKRASETRQGLK